MGERIQYEQPRISIQIKVEAKRPNGYSHEEVGGVHVSNESIPETVDPIKYVASRLNEELRRQSPVIRERYTPKPVGTQDTEEVSL